MRFLRRLLPPRQEARCLRCGTTTRERWRKPCPNCGDLRRLIVRSIDTATVVARDEMG